MSYLLQALLGLVLSGVALSYFLPMLVEMQAWPAQNDAANQVAQMQAAGTSYIRNHFSALTASITLGGNIQITPTQLIADGDLAAGFRDYNVFAQNHILVVTQQTPGALEGMVYTYGGDTMPDDIAIRVGQAGPPNATVLLASDADNFEGAAGGESVPVAYFQNAAYPAAVGHLGAHILSANYAAEAPFLNRYATGNLDDNTLHTAQYMDGNNLEMAAPGATTGGGAVDMAGGNVNAAGSVTATRQVNTPMVADPTNPAYQVTMAGTSNLNALTVNGTETVGTAGGGTALTVNGDVLVNGDVTHYSDARLKENIRPIPHPLETLAEIGGYSYSFKRDAPAGVRGGKTEIGFLAQELRRVAPELVDVLPDGHMVVKYDKVGPLLAAAVNEQQGALDYYRRALGAQQRQIEELRGKIETLENRTLSRARE